MEDINLDKAIDTIKQEELEEETQTPKDRTYVYPNTFPKKKPQRFPACTEGEMLGIRFGGDMDWMRSGGLRSPESRKKPQLSVLSDEHLGGPKPKKKKLKPKRQKPNNPHIANSPGAASDLRQQQGAQSPVPGDQVMPFVPLNDI